MSRREAYLMPARARRSRDHFGTVSVRSKLLPLYVPVSPSPVSREASRDLWRSVLDRPFDDGRVQTAERGRCQRIYCVRKYYRLFNIHVHGKTTFIFPTFLTRRDSRTDASDQRGRRKTSEFHTSGAKRAVTLRGGVKW